MTPFHINNAFSARGALSALPAILLLSVTLAQPAIALDPGHPPDEYIVRSWGVGEGLPQSSVTAIAQSREGYIWLGTYSGLLRFDGVSFRVLNKWNTPALFSDRITALHVSPNGAIWVGTHGGGLTKFAEGEWRNFSSRAGLSNDYVTAILSDVDGALWVGTEYGLNRISGGEIASYTTWHGLGGNAITSLALDPEGRLLIGALDGGLSVLESPGSEVFKRHPESPARVVSALAVDGDGSIWIGALNGLYAMQGGEVRRYTREDGLSGNSVSALAPGAGGDVFIGLAAGGVNLYRDGSLLTFEQNEGFPDAPVLALLGDRDGNMWVGTDTRGLLQVKDPSVELITSRHGLTGEEVWAVLKSAGGGVWAGTAGGGLCLVQSGKVTKVFNTATGLAANRIRCMLEDSRGILWVGTEGGGLARVRNGAARTFTTGDGLSSDDVTALHEDASGTIYIGTASGLNRLRAGAITSYDRPSELGEAHIRTLFEDSQGVMHIGTREGLIKFYGHTPLPLHLNREGIEPDILCIHEDRSGILWIGTGGNGLIRYEENEVTVYTTREGLPDNHIFSIVEDGSGNLYMSSYVGIFRIPGSQLEAVRSGEARRFTPALYDEAEGLKNRQCSFEGEPSACVGPGGLICYPTIEGMVIIDPEKLEGSEPPPRAMIEGLSADNVPLDPGNPNLRQSPHVVQFDFTALDFAAPEKLRFEYMLSGYDDGWKRLNPGDQRTAYYFNLDPGDYVFRVRAAGNQGVWEEEGSSVEFQISRPFYRRRSFYAALMLALGIVAAGYIRSRRAGRTKPEKYSTSALAEEKVRQVLPKLERLMQQDKVYLDAELNLQALAAKVGIHYNYLSRIINEKFGQSYNDYVNGYRIEEAKHMLADPEKADSTILDIAYDTGFYSKSVFNTAFKKITGTTPSRYRKEHLKRDA